ncbi:Fur family transcriptional regulator [Dyadobacter luteus]|jgi:Fe2+ or Zn2+ uptake regulation protein|uniref:Fur family transcriptional regulator n=1 Tax=Dyadobacter luteus TaxID=2259619 RepID=A0A3D8Y6V0_9BACT|nr:transcriptional repressor [Dyadobacter luteus]REA58053.1 Fur family transcriptional regulator [Dyadobacter luteus]
MSRISTKIKAYCKAKGVRCPGKKLLVADYLQKTKDYTDAANLYLLLRNSYVKISPATVYQSLNWLTENGFVECRTSDQTGTRESRYRVRI